MLLQSPVEPESSIVNTGIVLCDFGLAAQLDEGQKYAYGTVGTPNYMAKEVVSKKGTTFAADIWSLGVVLFHCLTGRPPFQGQDTSGTYRRIKHVEYRWRSVEKDRISKKMRHLVDSMINERADERPTPEELLTK